MEYNTNSQLKYLGKQFLILTVIILSFVFVTLFGLNRIQVQGKNLSQAKVLNNQLIQKINILKNVQESVEQNVSFADIALPSDGVSLLGLNQIKNKSKTFGLTIGNIKITNLVSETEGIERMSISFDVTGDDANLNTFLNSFENTLPLNNINKLSITGSQGLSTISVSLNFYSSKPLTKIPSVSGQINELTAKELEILNNLSSYEIPEFGLPQANEFPVRDDLFN